jgi:arabinogalactan oligomer/maltooligosaccharide transport system permease protein
MATATRRRPAASLGLHALLLTASAIAVLPVAWVLITSVKGGDPFTTAVVQQFTLGHYRDVLAGDFPQWFANSLIVAGGTTVVGVLLAATAGYAVSRFRFPGHRPLMWMFLVTQMFPMAILIAPIYTILVRLGLIDTLPALVLANCTIAVPFCAWMLKGYFDTVPVEIDEAGRMDGLTPFGTFWRLVLPLARPGLAVTAFYSFLTAWGEVAYASRFVTSQQRYTLAVGMQSYVGQFTTQWGLLTAASVLVMVPAVAMFYLVQRFLVGGLTAGGTKG